MKENLINFIINLNINKNLIALLISMMPVLEIRGALPISILLLKISVIKSFILCTMGNAFIVLPLIVILEKFLNMKRNNFLTEIDIVKWWIEKTKKNEHLIKKYGPIGLLIFVAIPMPTTGAYTGALLACLLKIKKFQAFCFITLGIIIAGFITLIITKGIILI